MLSRRLARAGVWLCVPFGVALGEAVLRWVPAGWWLVAAVGLPYASHLAGDGVTPGGIQAMLDPGLPHGWWYYARSCDVDSLTDEVIDITVDHSLRIRSPRTSYPIFQLGGAIRAVGDDDTAFNGRGAGHTYNINGIAPGDNGEGFDEERDWARGLWEALRPYHTSVYVNFLMDEGEDGIRRAYGDAKYQRLKALKNTYDPDNFFRLNQNIPPG